MPTIAASIATGISRAIGLAGVGFGSSGGASRTIWPPGMTGYREGDVACGSIDE